MASIVHKAIGLNQQTLPTLLKPVSTFIKHKFHPSIQQAVASTGFHSFVESLSNSGRKSITFSAPQIIRSAVPMYSNTTLEATHLTALHTPINSVSSTIHDAVNAGLTPIEATLILALSILTVFVILFTLKNLFIRMIFGATDVIPVHVVDVSVLDDFDPSLRVANEEWLQKAGSRFHLHTDEVNFMRAITERSGIGHATHFSPGIVEFPPDLSLKAARGEAKLVAFTCLDKLFAQNNINPQDIDIIVTNCSLLNPTPSITSMIINHYKMRPDVQSFHLGGMGCGISPLSINVASSCLRLHEEQQGKKKKKPLAVVFSFESITQNIYMGRERAFMLQNALFRMGGAAILLTVGDTGSKSIFSSFLPSFSSFLTNPLTTLRNFSHTLCTQPLVVLFGQEGPQPRWTITHSTHIHKAANTDAYTCVYQDIDKEDRQGVRLDKTLMAVAASAITKNLQLLGPKILPLTAQLAYVFHLTTHYLKTKPFSFIFKPTANDLKKVIVPNFKSGVQHFSVHAGGRAVLTAIQESFNLSDADMKPSWDTLYRFGNTSSSSIWYEYTQVQNTRKPRKGDIMLLIAVGSGFKANLMTFKALRDIGPRK